MTNLKEQFTSVHKLFLPMLYKLWETFLRNCEVDENTNFWEKKANFPVKNFFDQFLSYYRAWQNQWNNL